MRSKGHSSSAVTATCTAEQGRPLAAVERALFTLSQNSPINLVVLVRIDGAGLTDVLPQALAALQQRHPLLRAHISGPLSRPRFELGPDRAGRTGAAAIPLRVLNHEDAPPVRAVVEAEMSTPFDTATAPLARLTCLSDGVLGCSLVLTLHHAIADGTSTASLVDELLERCRARLAGEVSSETSAAHDGQALPPPLTRVLPRDPRLLARIAGMVLREGRDEVAYRSGSRRIRRPVPPPGRAGTTMIGLDHKATTQLVGASRHRRLTLTGLLTAALLEQASVSLYRAQTTTMRVVVWVDLRPHLHPPVGDHTLGCYISMLRFVLRVDPREELDALAMRVQSQIERAARRGDRVPAALSSALLARAAQRLPLGKLGTVALSHTAASAIRESYGQLTVSEVRAFVSNIPLGADLAAASGVTGGRLWCNLLYLDSDIDEPTAAAAGDGLVATLTQFARA